MAPVISLLYVILMLAVGYALLCLILRGTGKSLAEICSLVFGIGAGTMSFLLFWASLAGQRPSRGVLGIIAATVGVLIVTSTRKGWLVKALLGNARKATGKRYALPILTCTLLFLLALVVSVSLHALSSPLYEWDAFSIWGLKAKVLFHESLLSKPAYFNDVNLSYSHLDYPLAMPFLVSGVYSAMGVVDDQWGKIVFPFLFVAVVFMLYYGFRWKLDFGRSLVLVAICVGISPVARWAGSGNADLLLTFFYGSSVLHLLKWVEDEGSSDVVICALFSAFCAFTKNEGLPLAVINLLVLLANAGITHRKETLGAVGLFAATFSVLVIPWLLWSLDIPKTHENYGGRVSMAIIINNLGRLKIILPYFIHQIFWFERWGGVWMMLIALSVIGWKAIRTRLATLGWMLMVMHIILYILVFIITPWDVTELLPVALDRLLMHIVPIAGLVASFHWASLESRRNHERKIK